MGNFDELYDADLYIFELNLNSWKIINEIHL